MVIDQDEWEAGREFGAIENNILSLLETVGSDAYTIEEMASEISSPTLGSLSSDAEFEVMPDVTEEQVADAVQALRSAELIEAKDIERDDGETEIHYRSPPSL